MDKHLRITTYLGLYDLSVCCFQPDSSTTTTAEKLLKISAQNSFILLQQNGTKLHGSLTAGPVRLIYESNYA